jgi:hypothetical protein
VCTGESSIGASEPECLYGKKMVDERSGAKKKLA